MARNGTGVFAMPYPIQIGALRSSSAVNSDFSDAGDEITNSLPLDATAGMSGQFKAVAGSAVFPGIAFGADRNVGFRLRASDDIAWVAGGLDRMAIDDDGDAHFFYNTSVAGALVVAGPVTGASDLGQIEQLDGVGLARRTGAGAWTLDNGTFPVPVTFDAGAAALVAGAIVDVSFPMACTLLASSLFANTTGSASVSIGKATYANYPTFTSIVSATPPSLVSAAKYADLTLAGWTVDIAAGDILRFTLSSVSGLTRLQCVLAAKRYI